MVMVKEGIVRAWLGFFILRKEKVRVVLAGIEDDTVKLA